MVAWVCSTVPLWCHAYDPFHCLLWTKFLENISSNLSCPAIKQPALHATTVQYANMLSSSPSLYISMVVLFVVVANRRLRNVCACTQHTLYLNGKFGYVPTCDLSSVLIPYVVSAEPIQTLYFMFLCRRRPIFTKPGITHYLV